MLDVSTRTVRYNGKRRVCIELHNFGESRAVALQLRWRLEAAYRGGNSTEWAPTELSASMVAPGQHVECELPEESMGYLFCRNLFVEVSFSSAKRRVETLRWAIPIEQGWPMKTGSLH